MRRGQQEVKPGRRSREARHYISPDDLAARFLARVPWGEREGQLLSDSTNEQLFYWATCPLAPEKTRVAATILGFERLEASCAAHDGTEKAPRIDCGETADVKPGFGSTQCVNAAEKAVSGEVTEIGKAL